MNFLYLTSDKMGEGDPELGRELMANFLGKLAVSETPVDAVGCVNNAIFLTTEGSPVLNSLETLAARGAQIYSCATCLDHHNRRHLLRIGQVGSMDGTLEMLTTAQRVIRP